MPGDVTEAGQWLVIVVLLVSHIRQLVRERKMWGHIEGLWRK